MLRYMIPLLVTLSSATSWRDWTPQQPQYSTGQVASESQVKFALESKYDDTGPGAKQPEYAYNTYKNLEDALVAYLDDPDTKLPEHERAKAINKLTKYYNLPNSGKVFHKEDSFKIYDRPQRPIHQGSLTHIPRPGPLFYSGEIKGALGLDGNELIGNYQLQKKVEPIKFHRLHTVKGNPLSLAHYSRDPDLQRARQEFDPHPKYTFSYGVHDKTTGDLKTAQETRDGGNVRGFYSFIDSDGKTRTVHYTADDRLGFRADVRKSN